MMYRNLYSQSIPISFSLFTQIMEIFFFNENDFSLILLFLFYIIQFHSAAS